VRPPVAAASAFVAAIACAGAPGAPGAPGATDHGAELGKPFTLAAGESASLDAGKLVVRFVAVGEDSRCPKGEQCVWAGNARVDLEVRVGTGSPQVISLNTNQGTASAELDGYGLALHDVAPQPIAGRAIAPEDYRVTVSATRGPAPSPGADQPVR